MSENGSSSVSPQYRAFAWWESATMGLFVISFTLGLFWAVIIGAFNAIGKYQEVQWHDCWRFGVIAAVSGLASYLCGVMKARNLGSKR